MPLQSRKRLHAVDPVTGFEPGKKSARTEAAARVKRKAIDKEIHELASKADYDGGASSDEKRKGGRAAADVDDDVSAAEDESGDAHASSGGERPHPKKKQRQQAKTESGSPRRSPPRTQASPRRPAPLADPVAAAVDPDRFEIYRVDRKRSELAGNGVVVVEVADVGSKQVRRERRWQPKHFDSACCGRWFVSLEEMEAALPPPPSTSVAKKTSGEGEKPMGGDKQKEKEEEKGEDENNDAGRWSDTLEAARAPYSSSEEKYEVKRSPRGRPRKPRNPDQPPVETTYRPRVESYYDCLDSCDGGNIHVTLSNLDGAEAVRAVVDLLRKAGDLVSVVSRVTKKRAGTARHRVDHRITAYVRLAKDFAAVHAAAAEIASRY